MPINSTVIYSTIPVKPETYGTFTSTAEFQRDYRLSDCVVC